MYLSDSTDIIGIERNLNKTTQTELNKSKLLLNLLYLKTL